MNYTTWRSPLQPNKETIMTVFEKIEALVRVHLIITGQAENITIDNLCIKYSNF